MALEPMGDIIATQTVRIANPQGLHARPAELFARQALEFESTIEVIKDGNRVDAKSILHILTLGAEKDTELVLEARGADAQAAIDALVKLVNSDQFIITEDKPT